MFVTMYTLLVFVRVVVCFFVLVVNGPCTVGIDCIDGSLEGLKEGKEHGVDNTTSHHGDKEACSGGQWMQQSQQCEKR